MEGRTPRAEEIQKRLTPGKETKRIGFDTSGLGNWDSSLLIFLSRINRLCAERSIEMDLSGLPAGVRQLMAMSKAMQKRPQSRGGGKHFQKDAFLNLVGGKTIGLWRTSSETIEFLGDTFAAFGRFLTGRAAFRRSDLTLLIQDCGVQALPIVSLISLLVGWILAFIGVIQLQMFGAQIFVADLVGIGMVRLMGAVMTGVIMAGRTGAAFAAQIGTMQVNEEVDALHTFGISPIDFLVLPRMLALIVMMPLLCLYANAMGILGGVVVGTGMLGINLSEYLTHTREAITMTDLWIGLFHSVVFGVLIAMAGCLRGMQCGRSASAVGEATTSAVVTSIVAIVVATAVITFGCQVLGI